VTTLGFSSNYTLSIYREFSHWSPLDLVKGVGTPNCIYTLRK
jgi:hypothetical protein